MGNEKNSFLWTRDAIINEISSITKLSQKTIIKVLDSLDDIGLSIVNKNDNCDKSDYANSDFEKFKKMLANETVVLINKKNSDLIDEINQLKIRFEKHLNMHDDVSSYLEKFSALKWTD